MAHQSQLIPTEQMKQLAKQYMLKVGYKEVGDVLLGDGIYEITADEIFADMATFALTQKVEGLRMAEEIVRGWTLRIGGQLEGSLANLKLEEGTGLQDLADAIRSEREKVEKGL